MYIRKPTSKDSAKIREILKLAGLPSRVKLSLWSMGVGNVQCVFMKKDTALALVKTIEDAGYIIHMRDCTMSRIESGIFDRMLVQISG